MAKIISFLNQKGGVGKSTICFNLSFYISNILNKKTLIIDTDPQGSIISIFNLREANKLTTNNLNVISCFSKQLESNIKSKNNEYDYIIIDTQGTASIEILSFMKKQKAYIIVPTLANFLDIEATNDVIEALTSYKMDFKILINGLHHSASASALEVKSYLKDANIDYFQPHLTYRNIYKKSLEQGKSIFEIENNHLSEFKNFANDVIKWTE